MFARAMILWGFRNSRNYCEDLIREIESKPPLSDLHFCEARAKKAANNLRRARAKSNRIMLTASI